jgi:hypothetical protein
LKHSPSLGAGPPVTRQPRLLVQPGKRLASSVAIQQAKNPARGPQFLQIVAKPEPKLTRVAFRVSRLMEFCSERELQNQTGHAVYEWPLVVAKELIDNGLDACEEAEVAPEIAVIVEKDTIEPRRNGMIRVTYGSSCKATQLGGMENAPKALARIILAEQAREAFGHNEAED